jgi:hypothetical protein
LATANLLPKSLRTSRYIKVDGPPSSQKEHNSKQGIDIFSIFLIAQLTNCQQTSYHFRVAVAELGITTCLDDPIPLNALLPIGTTVRPSDSRWPSRADPALAHTRGSTEGAAGDQVVADVINTLADANKYIANEAIDVSARHSARPGYLLPEAP